MKKSLTFQEKLLKLSKQQKKKTLEHALLLLPIVLAAMFVMNVMLKSAVPEVEKEDDAVVTASFVGDIMFGRYVENVVDRHGGAYLFRYVEPYFEVSDYVTGNFEHPVTYSDDYIKADKYIHLHTSAESVETLKEMNFSVLNVANNHAMDYGIQGLEDTIDSFENNELDLVGAGEDEETAEENISYFQANGMWIATLGFTDSYVAGFPARGVNGGVTTFDPNIFIPMIAEAEANADLVVVHAHWGQEYDDEPTTRQQELAKAMADAGADIVIGHHPHVLQSIEIYEDTVIFYSLGNFVFDQGWTRTRNSALAQYKLMEDGTGRFEVTPFQIREGQPRPVASIDRMKRRLIFRQLTKRSGDLQWEEEDGKLVFEVDHSEKLRDLR